MTILLDSFPCPGCLETAHSALFVEDAFEHDVGEPLLRSVASVKATRYWAKGKDRHRDKDRMGDEHGSEAWEEYNERRIPFPSPAKAIPETFVQSLQDNNWSDLRGFFAKFAQSP